MHQAVRAATIVRPSGPPRRALEAVALVQLDRPAVQPVDRQADRGVAFSAERWRVALRACRADTLATGARHDGDREFGRRSSTNPYPGWCCGTAGTRPRRPGSRPRAPPRRRPRRGPSPSRTGRPARARSRRTLLPVVGVVEHVAQEAGVLRAGATDDDSIGDLRVSGGRAHASDCDSRGGETCAGGSAGGRRADARANRGNTAGENRGRKRVRAAGEPRASRGRTAGEPRANRGRGQVPPLQGERRLLDECHERAQELGSSAPSIARWSQVSASARHRGDVDLPSTTTGGVLRPRRRRGSRPAAG